MLGVGVGVGERDRGDVGGLGPGVFGELVLEAVAHVGGADGGEVRMRVSVEVLSVSRGEQEVFGGDGVSGGA